MNSRKIPLYFLLLALCATAAFAKKQPKFEQAHQLTADQAALVTRAVAREKVLIRAIQQHRYDDKALKAAGEFADALTTLAGVPGVETAITDYKLAAGAAGHPVGAK